MQSLIKKLCQKYIHRYLKNLLQRSLFRCIPLFIFIISLFNRGFDTTCPIDILPSDDDNYDNNMITTTKSSSCTSSNVCFWMDVLDVMRRIVDLVCKIHLYDDVIAFGPAAAASPKNVPSPYKNEKSMEKDKLLLPIP